MSESCYVCDGESVLIRQEREVKVGQRSVVVLDEFHRCLECGEEVYLPGMMDAVLRRASSRIRDQDGLLHPEEIRGFRSALGLSQADFERLLGVGRKTVVRWEKGTVFQSQSVDNLIRLLRVVPEALSEQARRQQVRLQRAPESPRNRLVLPGTVVVLHGFVGTDPFSAGYEARPTVVRGSAGLKDLGVQTSVLAAAG